jgi:tetratricopeptide (TPR) repeat protein/serine/threonine protein kinase
MTERQIFIAAVQKGGPEERSAYLQEACGRDAPMRQRIEALLREYEQLGSYLEPPAAAQAVTLDEPVSERPGAVIGPYKLLQQIGEGGMGTVFMAEQTEPVQRKVALKIIKPGMDSRQVIARFEAERQALALMDHPNIAKVLEAGETASGRPYFVMELVKGLPITKYCDEHHLTPRQRLELFVPVCQAVQHAHQKGIIHRDLKPSNVMVCLYDGKPVPKVIDFGVAKAAGPRLTEHTLFTEFGQVVGTFEYMSPEQAELDQLDIDTRSDIYSLGVLLYELLTGTTPLERKRFKEVAFLEVLRLIREEESPKPSTRLSTTEGLPSIAANRGSEPRKLGGLMRGELDWIAMKALDKDRNRRYETASGFALDILRYLADEAVQACPPSALYRFRKFARRNRGALAMASVIMVALVVVMATLAGGIGWIARDRATRQAVMKERVTLALEEARQRQQEGRWGEALAAARRAEALAAAGEGDAETRQQVREVLGDMQMLANLELARTRSTENQSGYDLEQEDSGYARTFREYGIDIDALDPDVAAEHIRARSICYELAVFLDSWSYVRRRLMNRGSKQTGMGWRELLEVARAADPDPWRDRFRKAVQNDDLQALVETAASAPISSMPAETVDRLGDALFCTGAFQEAAAFLRKGQRVHPHDFWINVNLAHCLGNLDPPQVDEAVRFCAAAVALRPEVAQVHLALGNYLQNKGRLDEAIAEYSKAIELDPKCALAWQNRGNDYGRLGQLDKSLADSTKAIELDPRLASAWSNRGTAHMQSGQLEKAIADYSKAIELDPKLAAAWDNRGQAYGNLAQYDKAVADCSKAIDLDPKLASAWTNRGVCLSNLGKTDKAIADYSRALELDPKNARAWSNRGDSYLKLGQHDKALADCCKAVELDPTLAIAWNNRGVAYDELGHPDKALDDYSKSIELDPKYAMAWSNRGNAYSTLGQMSKALADHSKAIELEPKNGKAWHNRGSAYENLGQNEQAIADFTKAIEVDPKLTLPWISRSSAYVRSGPTIDWACRTRPLQTFPKPSSWIRNTRQPGVTGVVFTHAWGSSIRPSPISPRPSN